MYFYIKGLVVVVESDYIVIENNGIGYKMFVSHSEDYLLNSEVTMYIYQVIREDEHYLIGFIDSKEKDIFLKLINVKGIGPKTAINALSKIRPNDLLEAILLGNVSLLKTLPGIGSKAASQIVLDLKGELKEVEGKGSRVSKLSPKHLELKDALKVLGYKANDIDRVIDQVDDSLEIEDMIRVALKCLRK